LQQIVAGNAEAALGACGELLMGAAAFGAFDLVPAATSLVAALPGDPARTAAVAPWKRPPAMDAGIVADILMALDRIDSALAGAAVDIFLGWPNTYDPDAVLIPTVLALDQLTTSNAVSSPATVERLRAACRAHLGIRIAEPLVPPRDWTRDATLSCRCKYCGELRAFLADPALQTWSFKSLQGNRSHVEQTIRNSGCDLNTETVRRGSPHSLVCTKNQASYDRRARQRRKDLKDLAGLEEHEAEIG